MRTRVRLPVPLLALSMFGVASLGTVTGCRTHLLDAQPDGAAGVDLSVGDLQSLPDLLPPRDFSVLPDLVPGPDLIPPHYCDGIFVFDENNQLSFFDPKLLAFFDIAMLNCPTMNQPFSMGVDNKGTAWVEYVDPMFTSSQLFEVDTYSAACRPTAFQNPGGNFPTFGMGFAANAPGSAMETLYIAGDGANGTTPELGSLNLTNFIVRDIGALVGRAELTGTGMGDLWAFFADVNAHLGQVDKTSGALLQDFPLPQLGDLSQDAFAWGAFGGVFYVFLSDAMHSTTVWRFDPTNNQLTAVLQNTGRHIVGAGVSTCAPTM